MKRIAVLTSGGDAPGMNAAIRAVVRCSINNGWEVMGVRGGFAGLVDNQFVNLGTRDVGGIIQRGGTILGSARCLEFKTPEGQREGIRNLNLNAIDSLIVIGGNGSQSGSDAISKFGFQVVGIASTIDNDLFGSDITIGVDTALNIALEAIDRLKTTASSHQRAFLIEVMGRNCGYLALMAGIAGGAESIIVPEVEINPEMIAQKLSSSYEKGKPHAIVVVAEGAKYDAEALVAYFKEHKDRLGFDLRATILGHVQRGGAPGAFDRILATRLGAAAVNCIKNNEFGVMVGQLGGTIKTTPLKEVANRKKELDFKLLDLANILD